MGKSRYAGSPIFDGRYFSTYRIPVRALGYREIDIFEGVRTFKHTIGVGERADHLAAKFLNDDSYWWVICLGNGISYPFASGGWTPGREIRIPFDVQDVLDKLF